MKILNMNAFIATIMVFAIFIVLFEYFYYTKNITGMKHTLFIGLLVYMVAMAWGVIRLLI